MSKPPSTVRDSPEVAFDPRFGKLRHEVTAEEWREKVFRPMTGRQFLGHWQCRRSNARLGLPPAFLEALDSMFEVKAALAEEELRELNRQTERERERARELAREMEAMDVEVVTVDLGRGAKRKVRVPIARRQVSGD